MGAEEGLAGEKVLVVGPKASPSIKSQALPL